MSVSPEQKRGLPIFCNEKSLSWRLDGCTLPSRFINEIPEKVLKKMK